MYKIANYDRLYKPVNTKGDELINAYYVKMPVKPRGKGILTLLKNPKGLEFFGIWALLLQTATETTKPELRGLLLNHKDEPANVREIAEAISLGRQTSKVKKALDILVDLGWVNYVADADEGRSEGVVKGEELPLIVKSSIDKSNKDKAEERFNIFWSTFKGRYDVEGSKRVKGSKHDAQIVWKTLTVTERQLAIEAAPRSGGKYTQDACRWLKSKRWEDDEITKPKPPKPEKAEVIIEATAEQKAEFRKKLTKVMRKKASGKD